MHESGLRWEHVIVLPWLSFTVAGSVSADVEVIDGVTYEFVAAGGFEQRLGDDPDTVEGFPARWRVFGPLAPETTRIRRTRWTPPSPL